MRKLLVTSLLVVYILLITTSAHATWKFNPFTGELDYYEAAGGGGDVVTVDSAAIDTTANFKDGTIDFSVADGGAGGPDDITADLDDTAVSGLAAVGTFESGDTFLVLEAGVGLREADYDDLPGTAEVNDLETTDPPNVAANEFYIGTGAGAGAWVVLSGEVTNVLGALTLADSVAVTSWNLTTPTITTSLTTSTPTTLAVAELDRLDGLTGIIVTDATACTDLEGTGLSIVGGVLTSHAADGANVVDTLAATLGAGADANDVDITSMAKLEGVDVNTYIDMDTSDTITTKGNITPSANAADDLGSDALEFNNAWFDGTMEADTITEGGSKVKAGFRKSFVITGPTATADGALWRVPAACTITAVHGVQVGGTNVVGHLTECDANGLNAAGVDGATDITILTTNVNDDGGLSNPSIDSGDYIGWRTTSVSGTITRVTISFEGTWD